MLVAVVVAGQFHRAVQIVVVMVVAVLGRLGIFRVLLARLILAVAVAVRVIVQVAHLRVVEQGVLVLSSLLIPSQTRQLQLFQPL
jgi:hypothetical protein